MSYKDVARNDIKCELPLRRRILRAPILAGVVLSGFAGLVLADPYKDFFRAIELNDAEKIRLLLLRGVSPNSPDPELGPAIVYAAKSKSFDALAALLENPATDVNVFNGAGESALMFACLFGELGAVKRLIGRGAEVNHPGWTPLHYAASTGQIAVIEYLLSQYAYIDAASENGTTPLMMAARDKQLGVARLLVREGADPSLRNEAGLGASEYLLRVGATEEARWMRDRADEYLARYGTKADPVPAKSR